MIILNMKLLLFTFTFLLEMDTTFSAETDQKISAAPRPALETSFLEFFETLRALLSWIQIEMADGNKNKSAWVDWMTGCFLVFYLKVFEIDRPKQLHFKVFFFS